jgi:NADH-quinone oxidoreductase subunit K
MTLTALYPVSLSTYLLFSALMFSLGLVGMLINRKNLITLFLCIELMLFAVNTNLLAFSRYLGQAHGGIFVFFILTVAAAEAAIGLAILVMFFRLKKNIHVAEMNALKG